MIYIFLLNILFCLFNIFALKKYLHIFQLKDYNTIRYFKFFTFKKHTSSIPIIFILVFQILVKNLLFLFATNVVVFIIYFFKCKTLIKSNKTPLKLTNKIKRMYVISIVISIVFSFSPYSISILSLTTILFPILAKTLNIYDIIQNKVYIKKAQEKLKKINPKIIAITGSNGKTSVKNILLKMLQSKHNTQATPHSYNTPLGISKFINEGLCEETEYLILEYGARHKKDIKILCKTFGADYGVVTTISPQHLESFKNIKNIYLSKNQLPKYLKNKMCVFNFDNDYVKKMYKEKIGEKLKISINTKEDIHATNIMFKDFKTYFNLHINNNIYSLTTSLLGLHNITNILLATALANYLKIDAQNLCKAIENLVPTPHRLEYIKGHFNILDDSYNCSISSAKQAIDVLMNTHNKKMVITPGIIEGGKDEYSLNIELGKMLKNVDYVVIVGNHNKKAILDGLKSQNFKNIFTCENLHDANKFYKLLSPNDCILFLNDLPDDYN